MRGRSGSALYWRVPPVSFGSAQYFAHSRRSLISNPKYLCHLLIVDIVCMNLAGLADFSFDAAALDVPNFFGFFQEGFLYCPFLILLRPIRPSLLPVMQYLLV